jgi:hypothetical protein
MYPQSPNTGDTVMKAKNKATFRNNKKTVFDVLTTYRAQNGKWWAVLSHPISKVEAEFPTTKLTWVGN